MHRTKLKVPANEKSNVPETSTTVIERVENIASKQGLLRSFSFPRFQGKKMPFSSESGYHGKGKLLAFLCRNPRHFRLIARCLSLFSESFWQPVHLPMLSQSSSVLVLCKPDCFPTSPESKNYSRDETNKSCCKDLSPIFQKK